MRAIRAEETGGRASSVTDRVEAVDECARVLEELRLARHAVWPQRAREIVDDVPGRLLPVAVEGREHIVPALAFGNQVKAQAHQVRAPAAHDPASSTLDTIPLVEFRAADPAGRDLLIQSGMVDSAVVRKVRVLWVMSNLLAAIENTSLVNQMSKSPAMR